MKIETNAERVERLIRDAKSQGAVVPGRSLPKGYQWVGYDVQGRGSAAARRLRQMARQQEKQTPAPASSTNASDSHAQPPGTRPTREEWLRQHREDV